MVCPLGERALVPGNLDDDERDAVIARFGVALGRVVRDQVMSHALAAIATLSTDSVVFFGGTALSRTLLPDLRLSEDIDLIALGDRGKIGAAIQKAVEGQFLRSFGRPTFTPPLGDTRHPNPSVLAVSRARSGPASPQRVTPRGPRKSPTSRSATAMRRRRGCAC